MIQHESFELSPATENQRWVDGPGEEEKVVGVIHKWLLGSTPGTRLVNRDWLEP